MDRRTATDRPLAPDPLVISRRAFLTASALAGTSAALVACGTTAPTPTPTTPSTPTPTPIPPPPAGYFDALAELREAVRGSPDHLVAQADRLVAAKDADAIIAFVRDVIATYPAGVAASGDMVVGRRWGTRATLRGGAGTPREKADLLAELLTRAGFAATVVDASVDPATAGTVVRFRGGAVPPFDPAVDDERMALIRTVMGLPASAEVPAPLDPGGADSRVLAGVVLGHLPSAPEAEPFEDQPMRARAAVRFERAGTIEFADPLLALPIVEADTSPAPDAEPALRVRVTLEGARSDRPDQRFSLAEGEWSAEDLVGRRLFVGFPPPAETLEELILVRPRDVTVVIPVLAVRGPDLDAEVTRDLTVTGTPVTVGGDLIDTEDPDDLVRVGGQPVGPAGPPDPDEVARVASFVVTPNAAAFQTVRLDVQVLDADGESVEGLPANAFRILDEGVPVGHLLERSEAPAPRVLLLLDSSDSIPDAFRGTGAADVVRSLAQRLLAADPRITFRVAMVSFEEAAPGGEWTADPEELARQATAVSGFGSQLWEALADAARLDPTVIVMVTDGAASDGNDPITAPPPAVLGQVRAGPRALILGVGDVDDDGLTRLGEAGRLGQLAVDDPDAAVDVVAAALAQSDEAAYRFRYSAPKTGPETRDVRLELLTTDLIGTATYDVPPADRRARPIGLSGLYLTVSVGTTTSTRVLAGLAGDRPDAVATRLDLERVRRALFDLTVLEFEGAAPPAAVVLDDLYSAILALRPLAEATDRESRLAALAGLGAGQGLEPATLHALTVPLPNLPPGVTVYGVDGLTYETGLRVVLHRERSVPAGDGRATISRSVDLLPAARFTTAGVPPLDAFRITAEKTARLALAEAAGFKTSTVGLLAGERLAPVGFSVYDALDGVDRSVADRLVAAITPWDDVRPRLVIPADGTPTAAWAFDGRTGAMVGILADGSGGGSEADDIEDTFDDAESLLNGASLASDLAGAAGLGGFSFAGGVWIQLELTKLQKLKAATLMLATLQAPQGDIADLGDLACGLAAGAGFEVAGRIGGGLLGELGERAAAAASAADSVGGFSCG